MAGDWIKMRTSLLTNPKVNGIARALESSREVSRALSTGFNGDMAEIVTRNVMRHVTVSSLLIVWGAANEHTQDGVFKSADLSDIDDMVGIPGFGNAMESVGWAEYDPEASTVTLPNFNEYNTSGSSRSANAKSAAQRQKEYRERKKAQESDVTRDATNDVTRDRREEKRREEKKEDTSSSNTVGAADAARTDGSRGTRLPSDWHLPKAWGDWALSEFPHWTPDVVRLEADKFADHWRAQSGKAGRKADWLATWRNWCRSDIAQRAHATPRASPAHGQPMETAYQRSLRETAEGLAPGVARRRPGSPPPPPVTIDLETPHVPAIASH